jgi:hypothetical protein
VTRGVVSIAFLGLAAIDTVVMNVADVVRRR